ncbi:beta-1,3-glucan-binding protein-like isoform X3 [Formica exsecta]|uniref:beta-1,3-glucan-binding protein-like isoform X2 n=1 Tax=Formica exsecta TaxID=72781 RepID=UPI001141FCF9|nr:beta-1,3-glucan-binding protein-like isoform X2 [Formica exsecta]XP_029678770.1 beta-1,3-glucan-binding protein-like isoform X3 [Formica exsecta]
MFSRITDLPILWLTFALAYIFAKPMFPYVLSDPTFGLLNQHFSQVPDARCHKFFYFLCNKKSKIFKPGDGFELPWILTYKTTVKPLKHPPIIISKNKKMGSQKTTKSSTSRNETPKSSTSRNETPKSFTSRNETPESSTSRNETPKSSTSRNETPKSSTSRNETPKSSTSRNETPKSSTSRNETPTGRLLLEDNFNSFNASLWKREIKMPLKPDYEFCVYHDENYQQLVQIDNGQLFIKPAILEDLYGENVYGKLQLNRCTSTNADECLRQALSYSILPPIISARLTTKERFVLRYGKIEIRARFPQGDWLYPEMWLEPKYSTYGANYASGRVLLGISRGNENLVNATNVSKIYDARRLDFGVRVGTSPNIREILVSKIHEFGPRWTKDFHVYTTIWTSDGFTFLVDGEEIGRVRPDGEGWMSGPNIGRKNAPFDQEFYITLGVGAGGMRVFPDNTTSSGSPKPWRNIGAKALLNFWNSRNEWLSSWRQDDGKKTAFAIDYVKVWSH